LNLQSNISLKQYNTFGIDVYAKYLFAFSTTDELQYLLSDKSFQNEEKLVLGGGSNILFTKNVEALVLKNEITGIELIEETENYFFVKAGAGVAWHEFVMYCIQKGYAGIENLALIPGNVGASPMQNIGAYGVEIKDVFHSLEAIRISDNEKVILTKSACEFGYRESVFKHAYKNQFVITSVIYQLNKKPEFHISYGAIKEELDRLQIHDLSINAIAQAVMNIRRSKLPDPNVIGNAGSFFKNPEIDSSFFNELKNNFPQIIGYCSNESAKTKVAAGWLIENCGWKGYRSGDAGCHDKQSLVLVNFGKASGNEIFDLSEKIIESVKNKFGVQLQREVNIY